MSSAVENRRRFVLAPYVMLLPFVVLFLAFTIYPVGRSLVLSFHQTAGPGVERFVGVANYQFIFTDRVFWLAIGNTVGFAVGSVVLMIPLSVGLALLLNRSDLPWRSWFRLAFFATHLVGGVFVAVIFVSLLPRTWLSDPWLARMCLVGIIVWGGAGSAMVYILAALQAIPKNLYDAASVDGAGTWLCFWHVTMPGIARILRFLILSGLIGGLQIFELPYVIFGGPGPDGAGVTLVSYLFSSGFEQGDLGYASAMGWLLVAVVGTMSVVSMRIVFGGGK
jgi:ABC-type sugar transport system permease subunit